MKAISRFILITISILCISLSSIFLCDAWSQNEEYFSDPSSFQSKNYGQMHSMKAEITELLRVNHTLSREYNSLYTEYQSLQSQANQYTDEQNFLQDNLDETRRKRQEKTAVIRKLGQELDVMQNEIILKESKNAFMRGELLDFDEKQRLRRLQLKDLEYEKRELEMQIEMRSFHEEDVKRDQKEELNELKRDLQKYIEKEQDLRGQIEEIKADALNFSKKIDDYEIDNFDLDVKIKQAKMKRDLMQKQISIMKDKMLIHERSQSIPLIDKEREKVALQEAVQALQDRYNSLNQKVQTSLSMKSKNQELMKNVIEIDRENQGLRDRITNLQKKIKDAQGIK